MYPSPEAPTSGVFVEQQVQGLLSAGVEVRVIFIDRRQEGAMAYYRMAPSIRDAVKEFEPDLVHVMYGGVMADQVTRQYGLPPVVVTFHGSDLLGENLSGMVRKLISRYGVYCSRRAARRAAGVVVVARHLLKALPGLSPTPSTLNFQSSVALAKDDQPSTPIVRVIPCGIDLDRFKPMNQDECRQRLGWSKDTFHVLFASANNDPVKRPWLARAAIEETAKLGIRVELHQLAGVPNTEVPVWFNASDALLLTSLHEGSPTVVKEALACGIPVVSVDVGDVTERLEGIEGCHLAKSDPADLARQLRRVWERRQRLSCQRLIADLSHMAIANQLRHFYEHVTRKSPARAGTALATSESLVPLGP